MITVPVRELTPPPDMIDGVGAEYLVAVCLYNGELYMVLNIDALLRPADLRRPGLVPEERH